MKPTEPQSPERFGKGKVQLVSLLRRATADMLLNAHNRRRTLVAGQSARHFTRQKGRVWRAPESVIEENNLSNESNVLGG